MSCVVPGDRRVTVISVRASVQCFGECRACATAQRREEREGEDDQDGIKQRRSNPWVRYL